MRNRFFRIAAGFFPLLLLLSGIRLLSVFSASAADAQIAGYAEEIVLAQSGGTDVQAWLDGVLTPNAGQSSADFYVMAIAAQGGYDLSGYGAALQAAIPANTSASATSKERMALALLACTQPAPAICTDLLEANAEKLGVMSRVFGLHLCSNGISSKTVTNSTLIASLLSLQCEDGGWSVSGGRGDPDVTAMVMQALAPYRTDAAVQAAVGRGVTFLSEKQLQSGAFQSYGTENAESTAQVWIALSCMGVDALHDARFLKNGNSLLDGLLQFRVSAGAYAHSAGGSANASATMQVYLALTAAQCPHSFYLFHDASPVMTQAVQTTGTSAVQTTAATVSAGASQAVGTQTVSAGQSIPPQTAAADSGVQTSAGTQAYTTAFAAETSLSAETETTAQEMTVTVTETADRTTVQTELLTTAPSAAEQTGSKYPYRIPLTAAAGVLFLGIAAVCIVRGKRSAKTYLTIIAGFGIVTAGIWLIRFETPAQYYQTETRTGGTVTMEIRCDVILGLEGSERFPADGIIMQKTEFSIDEGETALALLYDAVRAYQLQVEVDGVSGDVVETAYVRGIASLYEFDFGDLSGWTYTVNGERPPVGCGAYTLSDGDAVAWIYTVNL